jgi:hypothetical protein
VVDELSQVEGVEEMAIRFNHYVENDSAGLRPQVNTFVMPEKVNVADLNVSLFKPTTWSKPLWTYDTNPPVTHNPTKDLGDIFGKMNSKITPNFFGDIGIGLKDRENSALLDQEVLDNYIRGIRNINTDLTTWERFHESVYHAATFFKETITVSEMATLLEYIRANEKFMFILLYPYLFKPLNSFMWSYLYPIFSLKVESFIHFMKHVALKFGNLITHQSALVNGFTHLSRSKSFLCTLGTGGVSSLLLLYHNYFLKDNKALIPLYQGMGGFIGTLSKSFRLEGSKMIFELAKTASTFTNAALAGFLEPKQEALTRIFKNIHKK